MTTGATTPRLLDRTFLLLAGGGAVVTVLAAIAGPLGVAALIGIGLLTVTAMFPVTATYLYLVTLPFLAGMPRDTVLPFLRPNEAVLVMVVAGALIGGCVRYARGDDIALRLRPLDLPLGGFLVLSVLWPIVSMQLRGIQPGFDDLTALLPVCKLAGILLLVRITVRTTAQVRRCMRIIVATAAVVAAIAILQTSGIGPVVSTLGQWWNTESDVEAIAARGTSTLGHSIATGDVLVIALAVLVAGRVKGALSRAEGVVLGLVLAAGLLAAGQYSTWLAAIVAGGVLAYLMPAFRRYLLRSVVALPLVAVVGAPAFVRRVSEFADGNLPVSWLVRWDNVASIYAPRMGWLGALVGVSPNSVLTAPETWREQIWLESGFLQFLWIGGAPLLLSFLVLSVALVRYSHRLAERPDEVGACATALTAVWWFVLLLSSIDPHLYLRGVGDLIVVLIGVTTGRLVESAERAANRQVSQQGAGPAGGAG